MNRLVENASPFRKHQPRRGCTSATNASSRQGGKAAPCRIRLWGCISTDSRKAAPCGDLPRPTVVLLRCKDAGERFFTPIGGHDKYKSRLFIMHGLGFPVTQIVTHASPYMRLKYTPKAPTM